MLLPPLLQASEWTVVTEVERGGTMTMYCGSDICDDGDGGAAAAAADGPPLWAAAGVCGAANGCDWRNVCCIECKMEKMRLSLRSGWAEADEMDERCDEVDDLCDRDFGDEELDDDMDETADDELQTEANEIKLDVLETGR